MKFTINITETYLAPVPFGEEAPVLEPEEDEEEELPWAVARVVIKEKYRTETPLNKASLRPSNKTLNSESSSEFLPEIRRLERLARWQVRDPIVDEIRYLKDLEEHLARWPAEVCEECQTTNSLFFHVSQPGHYHTVTHSDHYGWIKSGFIPTGPERLLCQTCHQWPFWRLEKAYKEWVYDTHIKNMTFKEGKLAPDMLIQIRARKNWLISRKMMPTFEQWQTATLKGHGSQIDLLKTFKKSG